MTRREYDWTLTAQVLEMVRLAVDDIAFRDALGCYIGPQGLASYLTRQQTVPELSLNFALASEAVKMLVFLGILEAGTPGVKRAGYRRRYYCDRPPVTDADVQRYREYRRRQQKSRFRR